LLSLNMTNTNIDWTLTWTMVQAIFTALMAVAIIVTAGFAVKQLRETAQARHAEVLGRIHEILGDWQVICARQKVKSLPVNFEIESLNDEQRDAIELVTRSFDRAGFYLWCNLIREDLILPEYPGALWYWQKLEHYVKRQREVEGYEARRFFEYMASRTKEYRQRHGLSL